MFNIGDYLIYRRDVCQLKEIKNNDSKDYYVLVPINDKSLKIDVPIIKQCDNIRPLMTKDEILNLIKEIPKIKEVEIPDNRFVENEYKKLLLTGTEEDLIKIIKTTYLRNQERLDNNKKAGDKDNMYFKLAERYLYQEVSIVLNMSYDEAKKYIVDEVNKIG